MRGSYIEEDRYRRYATYMERIYADTRRTIPYSTASNEVTMNVMPRNGEHVILVPATGKGTIGVGLDIHTWRCIKSDIDTARPEISMFPTVDRVCIYPHMQVDTLTIVIKDSSDRWSTTVLPNKYLSRRVILHRGIPYIAWHGAATASRYYSVECILTFGESTFSPTYAPPSLPMSILL